jgi:hypothetical protein
MRESIFLARLLGMRLQRHGRHLALIIAAVEIRDDRPFRNRSYDERAEQTAEITKQQRRYVA